MVFKVQPKMFSSHPTLVEAVVVLKDIDNMVGGKEILKLLREEESKKKKELEKVELSEHELIKPWREAFKAFGSKPNKYSSSIEALLKRVLKGQGLPDINPLVNLYNYCSIKHMLPFGGEDFAGVYGDMKLRYCNGNEEFVPILSKGNEPPDKGEIAWCDEKGVTCRKWNWRQCDRTKIGEKTKQGYFIIDALPPVTKQQVEKAAENFIALAKKYLKADGEINWLDKDNPEVEVDIETKELKGQRSKVKTEVKKEKKFKKFEKQVEKPKPPFVDLVDESLPKYQMRGVVYEALKKCGYDKYIKLDEVDVVHPQYERFGDFATNVAMVLAKKMKKNPKEIAEKIKEQIKGGTCKDLIHQVSIAGGFINFNLQKEWLVRQVNLVSEKQSKYGSTVLGKGDKEMVEYNQANTNKHFHVGHLRNTSLGESLCRILEFNGFKVWRTSFQGDIGVHVAKTIWAIEKENASENIEHLEGEEFVNFVSDIYVKGANAYKDDEKAKEEIDNLNKKINDARVAGKGKYYDVWFKLREKALSYFDHIYERLHTYFDKLYFDSDVIAGKEDVLEGVKKGVFEKSEGAIVFPGEKYGLHTRVFINKRGVPTYDAKDIRLAKMKAEDFDFGHCIFVIGEEQKGYLQVIFKALELLGIIKEGAYFHRYYGFVNLGHDGKVIKMSSRLGNVVTAIDLIKEAESRIKKYLKNSDKSYTEDELKEITEEVSVGALKFSMLKIEPEKSVAFDLEKSISFEGNSAPYLQYTYARAKSILRKAKVKEDQKPKCDEDIFSTEEEMGLLRTVYLFPEFVNDSLRFLEPHRLCPYLFDLAQKFNLFYKKHKVLKAKSKEIRDARLALTAAVAQVVKKGLYLLGIEVLEKM